MRYLRRFFVLAVMLVVTGASQAQISKEHLRDSPEMLKTFRPVVAISSQATVRVFAHGKAVAYGTIVDADGLILTKWDEIRGSKKIVCRLHDGTELEAKLIGVEKDFDLAMLKVEASALPTVQWEDMKKVTVGRWVASAGTGEDPLAVGVVSVARRKLVFGDQPPRNSGYLGVQLADAMGMGAKITGFGDKKKGVTLKSPAEKAGIKVEDIIYEAAGKKISNAQGLIDVVGQLKPGDDVPLKITRGEEDLEITVKLGKRPPDNVQETMGAKLSERRGGFPFILQHDSGLRPELCGGPLVDIDGKAVGINIARAGRTETYAIPADDIQTLLPKFKSGELAPAKEDIVKVEPPAKEPEPILRKALKLSNDDKLDKDRQGLKAKRHMKVEEIELTAGVTYIIEMRSDDVDPYLILEDAKGTQLAADDNSGGFPNAKIVFRATETGSHRIIATTYGSDETGSYTLIVHVRAAKDKK